MDSDVNSVCSDLPTLKKKNALYPDVRERDCLEHVFQWTGGIPCTGSRRCYMCGGYEGEVRQGIEFHRYFGPRKFNSFSIHVLNKLEVVW